MAGVDTKFLEWCFVPYPVSVAVPDQSMGAYMALEPTRAMPENTAAVAAGVPCLDVPIGSHCTETGKCLCSFSSVAMTPHVLLKSVCHSDQRSR